MQKGNVQASRSASMRQVLIVDDDPVLCSVFNEGLIDAGFTCETAPDGTAALKRIESRRFDVMVTDVRMPGMDGLELTYRAKQARPGLAVIVMTGYDETEYYNRAIAVGASDFIKKPVSIPELVARINRVVRDHDILLLIRLKQEEVRAISDAMLEGVQDQAKKRIDDLEREIAALRDKLT